jgi:hypothetical protein
MHKVETERTRLEEELRAALEEQRILDDQERQ